MCMHAFNRLLPCLYMYIEELVCILFTIYTIPPCTSLVPKGRKLYSVLKKTLLNYIHYTCIICSVLGEFGRARSNEYIDYARNCHCILNYLNFLKVFGLQRNIDYGTIMTLNVRIVKVHGTMFLYGKPCVISCLVWTKCRGHAHAVLGLLMGI